MDTIYALATPRGKSGVAVIRLSGPAAHDSVAALAGDVPPLRRASLRRLKDAAGEDLDEAVVLTFAEGASFTGEASAELHLHGSHAVIEAVLGTLSEQPGLRVAEPGEFTRRALENETLDLAQIEGLADLIDAETEAQRKQAFRVLSGELGRRSEAWRSNLVRAAALLEATIDFADEEVPEDVSPEVRELIGEVREALAREITGSVMSERIRAGFEVAIVGKPNTGKSTLLNALAGREAAITSEIAGTTRDVIEVRMDLAGLAVTLLDTAGLREAGDSIEAVGIARARERAAQADLRVVLLEDAADQPDIQLGPDDIVLRGKADLIAEDAGPSVSGKTGRGVDDLIARVSDILARRSSGAGLAIRARHRQAMMRAITSLESALNEVESGPDRTELAAEDVRTAIRALESLLGRVDVEDVLDEIFSSFCLGK